jgi:hypothetical protein
MEAIFQIQCREMLKILTWEKGSNWGITSDKEQILVNVCLHVCASLLLLPVGESRILDEERVRTDLVKLIRFYVQIAMIGAASNVNLYALTYIVTDWMNDSFDMKARSQGLLNYMTSFDSVALENEQHGTSVTTTIASQEQAYQHHPEEYYYSSPRRRPEECHGCPMDSCCFSTTFGINIVVSRSDAVVVCVCVVSSE